MILHRQASTGLKPESVLPASRVGLGGQLVEQSLLRQFNTFQPCQLLFGLQSLDHLPLATRIQPFFPCMRGGGLGLLQAASGRLFPLVEILSPAVLLQDGFQIQDPFAAPGCLVQRLRSLLKDEGKLCLSFPHSGLFDSHLLLGRVFATLPQTQQPLQGKAVGLRHQRRAKDSSLVMVSVKGVCSCLPWRRKA